MPPQEELDSRAMTTKTMFHRLPKLIYVPFVWGEEDKAVWRAMKHSGKRYLVNQRPHATRERGPR